MWWGIAIGIFAVGVLHFVPATLVGKWIGKRSNASGLVRAVCAGVLFDVCSHGVLMISMQLYKKGLSLGQTVAFLIASPWNSFSLTFVLIALVGWKWALSFLALSLVIALITGWIFSLLEKRGIVPANPHASQLEGAIESGFWTGILPFLRSPKGWFRLVILSLKESRIILRWIFLGIVLAALIQALVPAQQFANWFGPGLAGLFLTLLAATVIEVCSEGSSPIAADLLNRAAAPGNAFTFLMAGVATDYTEVMAVRQTTRSWKVALLIPLLTIPQILLLAWWLNSLG